MLFHLRSPDRLSHDDGDVIDFLYHRGTTNGDKEKTVKTHPSTNFQRTAFEASTFTSSTVHFLRFGTLVTWTLFTKLWNNCQVLDPNKTGPNKCLTSDGNGKAPWIVRWRWQWRRWETSRSNRSWIRYQPQFPATNHWRNFEVQKCVHSS